MGLQDHLRLAYQVFLRSVSSFDCEFLHIPLLTALQSHFAHCYCDAVKADGVGDLQTLLVLGRKQSCIRAVLLPGSSLHRPVVSAAAGLLVTAVFKHPLRWCPGLLSCLSCPAPLVMLLVETRQHLGSVITLIMSPQPQNGGLWFNFSRE